MDYKTLQPINLLWFLLIVVIAIVIFLFIIRISYYIKKRNKRKEHIKMYAKFIKENKKKHPNKKGKFFYPNPKRYNL